MMACDLLPPILIYAIRGVLVVAGILVIVLMQKAEHDKSIVRIDSKELRSARRWSFISIAGAAVILLLTDLERIPQPVAFAMLLLFAATTAILVVDIVALNHRPPNAGHRAAAVQYMAHLAPLRRARDFFRRRA